ncbi:sigma-54 dependent transcriptional regulator [Pseudohongiella sp.]|uniref:Sigma-54 factor interaction domain-containing protein n=1 Tax=marine sediment metagenome TaxID=412755 RepID=A0A0F9WGN9_9ZZZZ|nr:sigma-54 dependent transcriptional regulator [Pseudohongiella sp.]HDZ09139.1 sigma-54-dependent Fis family transcriptional regulator [Pseudohongiella sp.]HEA63525.1 sigma-54-dependent Fis family transcriptional regulator [Pseudohongiella sp.]
MTQILVIEDSKKQGHDLSIVLTFLGESSLTVARGHWRDEATAQGVNPDKLKLILVGHYKPSLMMSLLEELTDWHDGVPLVILGDQELPDFPDRISARIVATIPLPLSYQPMLDAMHKAQVYGEHYARLRDVGSVRDYNMFRSLVGNSTSVQRIRHFMSQVADTEVTVLITGESGTGKEVVARNLHANSTRASKPFVPINCGAIPPDLLESELFGHEKGAFTGAISTRVGRFELAQGGTLFLDEIGDMPLPMQVKLLRVIQEQSYERVGGTKTLQTDVRILAATHRNLEGMIDAGTFRQDLYYRINVFPIEMPSLRERASDIPFLLNELISRLENSKRGSVRFNSAAIRALGQYSWPGNVRELANLVERMAIMHPHGVVGVHDLPRQYQPEGIDLPQVIEEAAETIDAGPASVALNSAEDALAGDPAAIPNQQGNGNLLPLNGLDLKEYLGNLERSLIEQALDDSGGVVARAADRLNIRRTTLVEKMRKYDMQR